MVLRPGDYGEGKYEVCQQRPRNTARNLAWYIEKEVSPVGAAKIDIGEGDHGVEVSPRNRPKKRNESKETRPRNQGVFKQLQANIRRRELLCGNTGPNDDGGEERTAQKLSDYPSIESWSRRH